MGKAWDFLMRRKSLLLVFLLFFSASFLIGRQVLILFADGQERAIPNSEGNLPEMTGIVEPTPSSELAAASDPPASFGPTSSFELTERPSYYTIVASPRDVALLSSIEVPRTGELISSPASFVSDHNNYGAGANLSGEASSLINLEPLVVAEILGNNTDQPSALSVTILILVGAGALFLAVYSLIMHFLR